MIGYATLDQPIRFEIKMHFVDSIYKCNPPICIIKLANEHFILPFNLWNK